MVIRMINSSSSWIENSIDRDPSLILLLRQSATFRDYQQAFETITGLPLALRAPGSFQAPLHGARRLNPFCVGMASRNHSCSGCLQLQQQVEAGANLGPKHVIYVHPISGETSGPGCQSPSQFNRVFLRIAGETPTRFRERLNGLVRRNVHVPSAA